jgi:predicted negative regulator of RcsB-dependent stress response
LSTKLSKDDVKSPDQVLKTLKQGFQWSQTHSQILIGSIIAFIVVGVGLSVYGTMSEKKESKAQGAYAQFEKTYLDKKRGFEEADREALRPPPKDPKNPEAKAPTKPKASGDMEKDYGPEVAGFQKVMTDHKSTKAAQMAALNLSEVYLNYKKADEAQQVLQQVEPQSQGKDLVSNVVLTQYGNVLSDKGDCPGAVAQWAKVLAHKEVAFLHDSLRLRSGFCYEKMNDLTKAEELYKKVSQNADEPKELTNGFAEPGLGKEAEKYLRLLKLKKGPEAKGS